MLQIQRKHGVVSRSSHDPASTTGTVASGRQAWAATGYWLLWVLCAGAYWRSTSLAVADAAWIAPLLLWLTVFKVAPVRSIPGRPRSHPCEGGRPGRRDRAGKSRAGSLLEGPVLRGWLKGGLTRADDRALFGI
jgi:hypothetical protein